jgi:putative transposase
MPYRAPNANAYAEPFIRSITEECLNRLIPFGEGIIDGLSPIWRHYHRERNHQALDNELIDLQRSDGNVGRVRRHQRLGGLLNYYARAA